MCRGLAHVDPRGCPEKFESGRVGPQAKKIDPTRPVDNMNIHIDKLTFTLIGV